MICRREHYADLGYAVEVKEGDNDHVVDFRVVTFYPGDGPNLYQRAGAIMSPDTVEDFDRAETYVSGSIKWDGCVNFTFDAQDECMLHACSREDLLNLGVLLARVHDLAGEALTIRDFEPATTREQREIVNQ